MSTTITKTFTTTATKYLAHGNAGAIYPDDFYLSFKSTIPTDATYVSCTLSRSITDSHDKFSVQYAYITDGDAPSSGTGYTYRYAQSTSGLNSAITAKGLWFNSFGLYLNLKNTSTYYDYSVKVKITATITYTIPEDPEPEPEPEPTPVAGSNSIITGDAIFVSGSTGKMVDVAGCYNKTWYDLQHGTLYYKDPNLGLMQLQQDAAHSSKHFNYKITRTQTTPAVGEALTVDTGSITSWSYDTETGLYHVVTSSPTLTLSWLPAAQPGISYYPAFFIDRDTNTTGYNTRVDFPSQWFLENERVGAILCLNSTYTTPTTMTFTQVGTAVERTYTFGFAIYSYEYQTYVGTSAPETFFKKINENEATAKYLLANAPIGLLNQCLGTDIDNSSYWSEQGLTVLSENECAHLTPTESYSNTYYYSKKTTTSFTAGNIYLGYVDIKANTTIDGTTNQIGPVFRFDSITRMSTYPTYTTDWQRVYFVAEAPSTISSDAYFAAFTSTNSLTSSYTFSIKNPVCVDITDYEDVVTYKTDGTIDQDKTYEKYINKFGDVQPLYHEYY